MLTIGTVSLVVVVAIVLMVFGIKLARLFENTATGVLLTLSAVVLAMPAVLFTFYYAHLFDSWSWFYQFRSIPGSEFLASGIGLLVGMLSQRCGRTRKGRVFLCPLIRVMMLIILLIPYLKPLFAPLRYDKICDRWAGSVCRQTTQSTCGPASAATVLKYFGISATEAQIAKECHTSAYGTENWYIARALRRRGLSAIFHTSFPPGELPLPCIAGVNLPTGGHFVAILPESDGRCMIADPLRQTQHCPTEEFFSRFKSTGFFMEIKSNRSLSANR
jgi:hypothetical protein